MSTEAIYNDVKNWYFFEGEDWGETIGVYRKCPECSRFTSKGKLLMNLNGDIKLQNWCCKKHGDVQPYVDRDCAYKN